MTYQIISSTGVKALPQHGGQNIITAKAGDIFVPVDSGWEYGTVDGKTGWVPSSSVQQVSVVSPVALGIYAINTALNNWRDDWASGQKLLTGVAPAIIHRFQPWATTAWSAWDSAWADDAVSVGSIPMISWEGRDITVSSAIQSTYSNAAVIAGNWDKVLIPWLQAAGAWGKKFLLRFFWEGNGQWYPWAAGANGNTEASYIAAFQHVARLVRMYAPEAHIIWCVGTSGSGWLPLESCYSGDAYVDYTSLDFYNTGPTGWSGAWVPFSSIKSWYDRLVILAPFKSIIVAETGCATIAGQDKAGWYTAIKSACATMPRIVGVVAFDNADTSFDFRVSDDPTVYAAWKALAANPFMQGKI